MDNAAPPVKRRSYESEWSETWLSKSGIRHLAVETQCPLHGVRYTASENSQPGMRGRVRIAIGPAHNHNQVPRHAAGFHATPVAALGPVGRELSVHAHRRAGAGGVDVTAFFRVSLAMLGLVGDSRPVAGAVALSRQGARDAGDRHGQFGNPVRNVLPGGADPAGRLFGDVQRHHAVDGGDDRRGTVRRGDDPRPAVRGGAGPGGGRGAGPDRPGGRGRPPCCWGRRPVWSRRPATGCRGFWCGASSPRAAGWTHGCWRWARRPGRAPCWRR